MNAEEVKLEHRKKARLLAIKNNEVSRRDVLRAYMVGAMAQEIAELRNALRMVSERWTFNNVQQHTHTWHDWADCIGPIKSALREK